jgi:hypothetical protein
MKLWEHTLFWLTKYTKQSKIDIFHVRQSEATNDSVSKQNRDKINVFPRVGFICIKMIIRQFFFHWSSMLNKMFYGT